MGDLDEYEEENIATGLVWLEHYSGTDSLPKGIIENKKKEKVNSLLRELL